MTMKVYSRYREIDSSGRALLAMTLDGPYPPGEQFLHHALLDLPRLGQFPFQRGDFGIHVAQDFGDGGVFR